MHPSLSCDPSTAGHSIGHGRLTIENYTGEPPAKQANSRHQSPSVTTFRGEKAAFYHAERRTSGKQDFSGGFQESALSVLPKVVS
jgi:uncharacterized protein with LGFP repeats